METTPALISLKYTPTFVQAANIKAIKPIYHNQVFGINWDLDLSLLLEIRKQNGSTYDYQLNIRGCFKKDSSGRIIGWGSAFKIQKLFNNLSVVGIINDDGTIEEKSLQQLIGKDIFVLNYISGTKPDGRIKFQIWDTVAEDRTILQGDFMNSNSKGYPKNYQPRILLEQYAETNNQTSTDSNSDFKFADSDDDQDQLYL